MQLFAFDDSYLKRLRDGDPSTESHFVVYFSQLLQLKLRARFLAPDAVDDLRQETFTRVLRSIRADGGIRARVVSMPCWRLFEEQDRAYRDAVLPPAVTARVAVEAGSSLGWDRFVGGDGAIVGIDRFGASAPGETVMREYGFTAAHVAETARGVLG